MKNTAPELGVVQTVAETYLDDIISVTRVVKGFSTYVYRVITQTGTYYLRFSKEDESFATEVLAHKMLRAAGVSVPHVIDFEHKNAQTGCSVMLIEEMPGRSIEDECPTTHEHEILREAGRQLARIHRIPVDGFGWIDKRIHDALTGEKRSFDAYFREYLEHDLQTLNHYPFSEKERSRITDLMQTAQPLLTVRNAVLVHGDFDISHIFHSAGQYRGIIDLGEIRGNNHLYDLATFIGFYQDNIRYSFLLEGYCETVHLTKEDLYATELLALFMLLRFLGAKVNANSREHWYRLATKQLDRIRATHQ